MISKIIQKEKVTQSNLINCQPITLRYTHKQSLINLKEYLDEQFKKIKEILLQFPPINFSDDEKLWDIKNIFLLREKNQLTKDIKEITKLIEKYE